MNINPLLMIDGYKADHRRQYPNGTEVVFSNLTPRKSRLEGVDFCVFFGLQYFLKEYLIKRFENDFFSLPRDYVLAQYKKRLDNYLGGDFTVEHIGELWDLGYLPLEIRAVPEGTKVPIGVPCFTIRNTDPKFFWLTNQLETILSCSVWQACTSATIAHMYRKEFEASAERTGLEKWFVDFQGHDFSFRGMSSFESACLSGAAHLLSFKGTDTIPAIDFIEQYYHGDSSEGASIAATEHSVMCMGGMEDEIGTYRRLINEIYPSGFVSIVSDTWDFWGIMTHGIRTLHDEIMARDGKVVFRPDCYDEETQILTSLGWKFFRELTDDDLVAQVVGNNEIEYIKPIRIVNQAYSGKMIRFSDKKGKVDLLVTPNHRMVWEKNSVEFIEEADKTTVGVHYKRMWRSASNKNSGTKLSPFERFLIAFQADGSFPSNHTKIKENQCGYIQARFTFTKQRKIDRLSEICEMAGLEYSISTEKVRDNQKVIYVKIPTSMTLLKDFSWVECDNSKLCSNWCREFVEEASYWDASRRSDSRFKFDSTNESVAHTMYNIATFAGYGVKYTRTPDNRKEHFLDVHTVHIMKNNMIGGQAISKSEEDYSGNIYCVQVPSGKIVVRRGMASMVCGNSGDPVKIVCGDPDAPEGSPERIGAWECLWNEFGGTVNDKGFKVLDSHVGLIYGDSITRERQKQILHGLEAKGFVPSIVLGIGSYTYQYNTRDTLGFAVKATWGQVEGESREIFKAPKTDKGGEKKSAKGYLTTVKVGDTISLVDRMEPFAEHPDDLMVTVFKDGSLVVDQKFSEIKGRLNE